MRGTWRRPRRRGLDDRTHGGTRSCVSRAPVELRRRASTTWWPTCGPTWSGRGSASSKRPGCSRWMPRPARRKWERSSPTTGSDGKIARWSDRSVVTEAARPEVFEFVTEGRREGKPGSRPWLLTAVHRYELAPEGNGCRVTYTEDLTRLAGAPRITFARGINRIVFRVSAKYMRRGFQGLLALAAERAGARLESADGA